MLIILSQLFLLVTDWPGEAWDGGRAISLGSPSKSGGRSGPPAPSTQVSALSPLPGFLPLTSHSPFLWLCQGLPGPGQTQGAQCSFLISSPRGKHDYTGIG